MNDFSHVILCIGIQGRFSSLDDQLRAPKPKRIFTRTVPRLFKYVVPQRMEDGEIKEMRAIIFEKFLFERVSARDKLDVCICTINKRRRKNIDPYARQAGLIRR